MAAVVVAVIVVIISVIVVVIVIALIASVILLDFGVDTIFVQLAQECFRTAFRRKYAERQNIAFNVRVVGFSLVFLLCFPFPLLYSQSSQS